MLAITRPEQVDPLTAIFSSQAGGHLAHVAPLIGSGEGVKSAPTSFTRSASRWSASAGEALTMEVEETRGMDDPKPTVITNPAFAAVTQPIRQAHSGQVRYRDAWSSAFSGRSGVGVLILATVVAWGLILGPLQTLGMGGMQGATMRVEVPLFMITWVVMLVAMMLPAVTPMVLTYQRITAARGRGLVMPVAFVLGYLLVWSAAGIVPLVFNLVLPQAQMSLGMEGWARLFAFSLFTVGLYQLSPWKTACLKACRSPLGFFMAHDFGAGLTGAVRLGGLHGSICVGCCWALMALMVVAGSMSTAWMAALALVFITEKVWRHGLALSRVVGGGALAAAVLFLATGWTL